MEKIFKRTVKNITSYNGINLRKVLIKKFELLLYVLPQCHNLKTKIIRDGRKATAAFQSHILCYF